MRDDNFLQQRLDHIWDRYFSDIEQRNDVRIQFGRRARSRLGSIKQSQAERISNNQFQISNEIQNSKILNTDSGLLTVARMTQGEGSSLVSRSTGQLVNPTIITINGLFKDSSIPEFLIDSVIAHEMVH